MPKFENIKKVLILGSGAIKIGEAGEFDYSGAQAIKAVKEEGIEVVLINPNVATIQTDKKFVGDKAYFLPITPEFAEKVIEKERPDGILLGFGGQTALNCGTELAEKGILEKYNVKVLGTSVEAIEKADDRDLFRKTMINAGVPIPKSKKANSIEEAVRAANEIGYPVMVRVAYTLGGQGTGAAFNEEQLRRVASIGLVHSRISQVLVEEYVGKWKEIEYEVLRDLDDNCMIVCSMENFDPMGVHTGDSIVVAPSQTVSDEEFQKLKSTSFAVLKALGLVGECNIQYAVHPVTGEYKVIEVNSRLSRSSALASKATGYPIAYVTAKMALGYRLPEIVNKLTGKPAGILEPVVDYIVVKMPRWDFQKFRNLNRRLGTQMKSVGEVMSIGKTFEEALQKAVRMIGNGRELTNQLNETDLNIIKNELKHPTDERLFYVVEAIRKGIAIEEVNRLTGIVPLFLESIKKIVEYEKELAATGLTQESLKKAKLLGFSDKKIGELFGKNEDTIRELRSIFNIKPAVKQIQTAKRWSEKANYLYCTYNSDKTDEVNFSESNKAIVLGSGCYRIGSSVEFDWCCVNTTWALKERGIKEVVMINCNPETVSTDFDVLDKLYFEELTLERVLDIVEKENHPSVVVSVGGQIPNNLALKLDANGIKLLGTTAKDIDRAEDRSKFSDLLDDLEIEQPKWSKLESLEKSKVFASRIGYPVLIRPSYVLSGSAMSVAYDETQLEDYLKKATDVSKEHPVVISKFMLNAREVEVDGVCDGENVFVGAIIEHVENAGVHSGDATMSLPAMTIDEITKEKIRRITRKIARDLCIKGPFNIQYLVKNRDVFVIECNLRASRSMPFVSKAIGKNLMDIAANAMLGEKIEDGEAVVEKFGVKYPQFSFMRLEGADPITGVEMVSTGEVACFGRSFEEALLKAMIAGGTKIPKPGDSILISVGGEKEKAVETAKKIMHNGYRILATGHTADALTANGIVCEKVYKISEGKKPNALDLLAERKINFVFNIPHPNRIVAQAITDGYLIRRKAVELGVPVFTNLELVDSLANALRNNINLQIS
ncbi:MAG: carbamoyl-phosphate synthase (glutamine-hydrolyzing) large subunit [Candidatus Bathyarchaeota archaeon]|nr:carbamoyl-phosphate synthase (glutamine-hydrolyzing) large subunit [Candidatus Bathyarchaeota archaeon]MDI9577475.1 carbamoyl-phosphate synthase (glutamine-hydrolyzing) large subunit [Thermoproteota archaeon]MDT8781158.1 carbamoyl-phosphate synthase (glutamine-hydrolyzing) large subunit [Candidatus Bathyarchaeota archaeon]NLD65807.1 carbamoyl-phosphate synthase (glutamine-hydrolyzing) large subunit [Thermoproteota archaeon]